MVPLATAQSFATILLVRLGRLCSNGCLHSLAELPGLHPVLQGVRGLLTGQSSRDCVVRRWPS